ncbi:hypothetical protein [Larkinella soli]|uniref:hypothetical protein n=1 Tax=Larkinella soli TaxID=1770527 RepID=UPI000FFBFC39|nr:hypothetical protein [Larkinella soli]
MTYGSGAGFRPVKEMYSAGIALVLLVMVLAGCRKPPVTDAEEGGSGLEGTWRKVSREECSGRYPDEITFERNGFYETQSEVTAVQPVWDVGTFKAEKNTVRISNSKDVGQSYRFSLKEDTVTFQDAQGCRTAYRRM